MELKNEKKREVKIFKKRRKEQFPWLRRLMVVRWKAKWAKWGNWAPSIRYGLVSILTGGEENTSWRWVRTEKMQRSLFYLNRLTDFFVFLV